MREKENFDLWPREEEKHHHMSKLINSLEQSEWADVRLLLTGFCHEETCKFFNFELSSIKVMGL